MDGERIPLEIADIICPKIDPSGKLNSNLSAENKQNIDTCQDPELSQINSSSNSNDSSSDYSGFEDEFEGGPTYDNALQRNIELMNKREEMMKSRLKFDGTKVVIYDCNSKIVRYFLTASQNRITL